MADIFKINKNELIKEYKDRVRALLMARDLGLNKQLGRSVKPYTEGLSAEDIAKLYNLDIDTVNEILAQLQKEGVIIKENG